MCSRHSENGAGHVEWNPRPWVVVMEDDDGGRYNVRVPAAIGRRDAMNQAKEISPGESPVDAEEAA